MKKATFGAGCFWGVEAAFRQIDGVTKTEVGYEGGTLENPTYEDVCAHTTGHAEVVEVTYDPEKVTYEQLLDVFWGKHDPTQFNRQGWDIGDQYRSVVFFHDRRCFRYRNSAPVSPLAKWPMRFCYPVKESSRPCWRNMDFNSPGPHLNQPYGIF